VAAGLQYARHHPETLVIVTADHGHTSQIIDDPQTPEHHSTGHTGTEVRVAAQGPEAHRVLGITDQIGILLLMLVLQALSANGPLDEQGGRDLAVLLIAVLAAPILLALSAKFLRHGWALGWIVALLAELDVALVLYSAFVFGLFFGFAALVIAGPRGLGHREPLPPGGPALHLRRALTRAVTR